MGEQATSEATQNSIELQVVKLPKANKGLVPLPERLVVERSFAWLAHFWHLSHDLERMPEVLAAVLFVVFVMLMLPKAARERVNNML